MCALGPVPLLVHNCALSIGGLPDLPLRLVRCHVMLLACDVQQGLCGGFCALGLDAMVCQLTLGVGLACPGCSVFVQSVKVGRCVMSGMLCLSVRRCSTSRDKYSRLFSGSGQTMQQCMWQSDIVGVVYYGTVCWCCWLMVSVVIGHLISPDVAGTDAPVIQFEVFSGSGRAMQQLRWQSDIVSVLYVRDGWCCWLNGEGGDSSSDQP